MSRAEIALWSAARVGRSPGQVVARFTLRKALRSGVLWGYVFGLDGGVVRARLRLGVPDARRPSEVRGDVWCECRTRRHHRSGQRLAVSRRATPCGSRSRS